jgi:hypothetical protein
VERVNKAELRSPRRGGTRLSLALQVVLLAALATLVAGLCAEAARWPFLRLRHDFSRRQINTLSEPTVERIRLLPSAVRIDVFFRPEPGPQKALVAEVQELSLDLLYVAAAGSDAKLELFVHDTGDLEAVQLRARELGQIDVANKVVLSLGERRALLNFDDWAEFQVDPTDQRRAILARFRGEEALSSALARLSASARPRVVFSSQRGELDLDSAEPNGVSQLAQALRDDGFEIASWDGNSKPPEPTDIVALLAPVQAFDAPQIAALRAHVEAGGRLFACADTRLGYDGPGSVSDLLGPFGLSMLRGFVCKEVIDPVSGQPAEGDERVALLQLSGNRLSAQHPITAPFVRYARRVVFPLSFALERGQPPLGTGIFDLVSSPPESWRETKDPRTNDFNFMYDGPREEVGTFRLLAAVELPARTPLAAPAPAPAPAAAPAPAPAVPGAAASGATSEPASQGRSSEGGSSQGGAAQGGSAQGGSALEGSALGGSALGGSARGNSAQGISVPSDSASGGSNSNGLVQNGSVQNGSVQNGPIQNDSIQAVPIQAVPIQGVPVQGVPVQGVPVQGVPDQGVPVQGGPMQGWPIQGGPQAGAPRTSTPGASHSSETPQRGRIIAFASPAALCNPSFDTNRDLWLSAFNWLARRDFRVVVAARDPLEGRLDLARGPYLKRSVQVGWYALPLCCLLLGLSIWLARRRA